MIIIAIIGILISLLLPSLRNSREIAKQAICMSNIKQIGKTSYQYSTDNRTYIVPSTLHHSQISDYPNTSNNSARARYSDYFLLGKYGINPKPQGSVWTGIEGWTPNKNSVFRCPSTRDEDTNAPNRYKVRIGINGLAFKSVQSDGDYSDLITQQEVINPGKLAAWVDCRIARFNPGWG